MNTSMNTRKTNAPPRSLDQALHTRLARFTQGLSPAAIVGAYMDWGVHLAMSPDKQLALLTRAWRQAGRLAAQAAPSWRAEAPEGAPCIEPLPQDKRFSAREWQQWPFNLIYQAFLLNQQWWHHATTGVRGVTQHHEALATFYTRQLLDMVSPSNFAWSNPEVLAATVKSGGANLMQGALQWAGDAMRQAAGDPAAGTEHFRPGREVAITPGKVVLRNELIELIQYAPQTAEVRPEPVLIVPAWIMKYYILDLSPHNSLVRYLVGQGFTVFMISWRNPTEEDRELGLEDYRKLGVDAAIAAINSIVPGQPIHAAGYCLGGTLLSIAAAHLATTRPDCLRSLTLLAAQTDFTEAGELTLFINESQVAFLEDMMWERGVLGTEQMAGAFHILRSNDLVWSRAVRAYLMGERAVPNDLMSWNADATRMPYRMHSEYLRRLFLNNELAEGRYCAGCDLVSLSDLHAPMFVVGTLRDHVAPWRSTYKINYLAADADITYVLASGGHNAGIVAPPGEAGHSYQVLGKMADAPYLGPDEWLTHAAKREGSWWPEWVSFLIQHSGAPAAAPPLGPEQGTLMDAPGQYVLQP